MMLNLQRDMLHCDSYKLSPNSLKNLCIETVASDILKVTMSGYMQDTELHTEPNTILKKLSEDVLPNNLAELLLEELSNQGGLNGDLLSCFAQKYSIKVLTLNRFGTAMRGQDLQQFSSFSLDKLHIISTPLNVWNCWNVDTLISSFAGSCNTLTSLKLELYPGVSIKSGNIFDFFIRFPNLRFLHYDSPAQGSSYNFTDENWKRLFGTCKKLRSIYVNINVSSKDNVVFDSYVFRECANLQSLTLRSFLKASSTLQTANCISYLPLMDTLRHLDLSIDSDPNEINRPFTYNGAGHDIYNRKHADVLAGYVNVFLKMSVGKLPLLEYLDLSGIFRLNDHDINNFIASHPNLYFLGLCMVKTKFCKSNFTAKQYPHLTISGCYLEDQIVTSLLAYPNRVIYMREVLKGLFEVSAGWNTRKPLILKLLMEVMDRFKEFVDIQWVATACIYQLCRYKGNVKNEFSQVMINEIGKVATITMIQFCGSMHIVKNCLLILSSDVILYNTIYNRASTAWICLGCISSYPESNDRYITAMAITVIAVLVGDLSQKERESMIQERDMKLFLSIIQYRLDRGVIDGTLRWLLEALWSFTDNSPVLIELFIDLGGLEKYLQLLDRFPDDLQIKTDILGLLFNIAEMLELDKELIMRVKTMTSCDHVPVSYFACGVLANFSLRWDNMPAVLTPDEKNAILQEIQFAIDRFGIRDEKIVNYKTFRPIYSLLESHHKTEIQHWAVWTIHHLCSLDIQQYQHLINETCFDLLRDIYNKTSSVSVREQISGIYKMLGISELPMEIC